MLQRLLQNPWGIHLLLIPLYLCSLLGSLGLPIFFNLSLLDFWLELLKNPREGLDIKGEGFMLRLLVRKEALQEKVEFRRQVLTSSTLNDLLSIFLKI